MENGTFEKPRIAVVVPSIRDKHFEEFLKAWTPLFCRHEVILIRVRDGERVRLAETAFYPDGSTVVAGDYSPDVVTKKSAKCFLFNFTDGVRNIGFLAARAHVQGLGVIVTLDDDVFPLPGCDPIQQHLDALNQRVPISWFSTASEYMRGFPYGVREEAEVWVSHGVWTGVHDYDGPTQLVNGVKPATFYKGPLPRGIFTPVCGMNLAFKVQALPAMYFAPMGRQLGYQRFADIWMGLSLVRRLDELGKAMVSGYSVVEHRRASNVFNNLEQEARGIALNEILWKRGGARPTYTKEQVHYLKRYEACREHWRRAVAAVEAEALNSEKFPF